MTWQPKPISTITHVVTKGTTPTTLGRQFADSGVNFIKAEALNGDSGLDISVFCHIDEDTHDLLSRSILQEDDVLVTIAGAQVGKCGYVKAEHLPANTNQAVGIVRVDKGKAVPRFVYYFFKQPSTFAMCQSLGGQAAQPNVNLTVLKSIAMPLPDPGVQRAIVDILVAYDDLIESNRRRIALLDEAARQLFREWFVRLRFPGHEHVRIVNDVPKGWERGKVASLLAKIPNRRKVQKSDYLPEGSIPCVDQSAEFIGGFTDDEEALYSKPLPMIVFGDHTRILKFVNFPFARGADGTQIIYPNTERISSEYLYFALKQIDLSNYFYARHFKFLKEQEVLLPDTSLVREFTVAAGSSFEQIQTLRVQIQKLRAARDLLLPRLMSGEIAV